MTSGQNVKWPVGVEKVHFLQNSRNLGDRKCLGKSRKSFVGHPDAILFLRISREGVFQQPRLVTTVAAPTTFGAIQRKAAQTSGGLAWSESFKPFRLTSQLWRWSFSQCLLRPDQSMSKAVASSLLKQLAHILRDNDPRPFADRPVPPRGSRQEGMRLACDDL